MIVARMPGGKYAEWRDPARVAADSEDRGKVYCILCVLDSALLCSAPTQLEQKERGMA